MALLSNVQYKGFCISDCYIKVEHFTGNKSEIVFSVSYKKDSLADSLFVREFQCSYSLEGGNILEQTYAYLKALPEFADAVDC